MVAVMTPYTRHQLLLVLVLVVAAGVGLAVDHWRRAHPTLAEHVEAFDRTDPAAARALPLGPAPAPGPARRSGSTGPLDVNQASAGELVGLPGIGPALASRIVAARPFGGIDELARVPGLRRGTLERLRPLVTVGAASDAE